MRIVTRIRALVVAVLMVLAGLVATASPASAHHPIVKGNPVCNEATGLFDITWTIGNSENDKTMSFTSRLGSGSVGPNPATTTQTETGVAGGRHELVVNASWPNGVTGSVTGRVNAYGDCEQPPADQEVTPAGFTVTPPTCDTDGQGTIPEQPEGVSVTPAPGNYGVGTQTVTFTAEDGYVLTNDPSGDMVVEGATGYQDDDPSAPCYQGPEEPKTVKKTDRRSDCVGVERRTWTENAETGEVIEDSGWVTVRKLTRQERIARDCIEVEGEEEETPNPNPSPNPRPNPAPAPRSGVSSGVPTAVDAGI